MHLFETPSPHPTVHIFGKADEFYDYGRDGFGYKPQEDVAAESTFFGGIGVGERLAQRRETTAGWDGARVPGTNLLYCACGKKCKSLEALRRPAPLSSRVHEAEAEPQKSGCALPASESVALWVGRGIRSQCRTPLLNTARSREPLSREPEGLPRRSRLQALEMEQRWKKELEQLKDGHEQLFAQLESLEEEIAHLEEPQKAAAEQQRLLAQQLEQMQPELLKKEWGHVKKALKLQRPAALEPLEATPDLDLQGHLSSVVASLRSFLLAYLAINACES
eukprot:g31931.t1